MALRSMDLDGERHEHVALAFYLPHGTTLQLTNQDGMKHLMVIGALKVREYANTQNLMHNTLSVSIIRNAIDFIIVIVYPCS